MIAKLDGLPPCTRRRSDRYLYRVGTRRDGFLDRHGHEDRAGDVAGRDGTDMTTATDVIAIEKDHLLQVYRRGSVVFERGRGCRLFDAEGRGYLDLISGVGVAALGHAHPRLAAAISAQAQELLHTSNLFFHPLQGELAARLSSLSGLPRAFFCNSGTEAVEASLKFARRLLAHAGAPAPRVRRPRAFVPRADDGLAVGDVGRSLPRAVRAARAGRHVRAGRRSGGARRGGHGAHRRGHRRADSGRRRRSSAHRRDGGGDYRSVQPDGRAAHRRRSAVRARADRPAVLLGGARPAAGPHGHRQVARGGRADCGGALQRPCGGVRGLWRSRQHVRRQPARLPRGARVSRGAGRRRAHGPRGASRRAHRGPAARARGRGTRASARCAERD